MSCPVSSSGTCGEKVIQEFIAQFTQQEILYADYVYQLGKEWYLVVPELLRMGKALPRQPVFVGQFLGRQTPAGFFPGVDVLRLLVKTDAPRIFVTDKSAWLFVCGKNVLQPSITKTQGKMIEGQLVLVMLNDECLGYGRVEKSLAGADGVVKRVFDIGDFLRRERPVKFSGQSQRADVRVKTQS